VAVGIALLGAAFYALANAHFVSTVLSRTLGPYTDALAEGGFAQGDPEIWQKIAAQHRVSILVEPVDGVVEAFDDRGQPAEPGALERAGVRAPREGPDGTRVTFYWSLSTLPESHLPQLGGLVVMVVLVVGSAYWFLRQQLRPLEALRGGVDSVAKGDFAARVPVVREDEIGQVAEAFNSMAERVGGMIDDRERLLADVSHELRSPIARMKVAVELLPEGGRSEDLRRDLTEMETLIGVLLDRERLRWRTGRLELQRVDLDAIASDVVDSYAGRDPGIELVSPGKVEIRGDSELVKLLIQNLLDNALKFSLPGSEAVRVSLETRDGQATLRVADDGVGLPPGGEERLFDPFVKGDPARGHHAGYGLGLNLCQRIVDLHGGAIRLLPREPRGCCAEVTLSSS